MWTLLRDFRQSGRFPHMAGNEHSGRRPAHEEMRLKRGEISSRQLSDITGVSMGTLHTWVVTGFITVARVDGEGKGSRRVFKESVAVDEVRAVVRGVRACPYEHKDR